jgi:hypothetical protein
MVPTTLVIFDAKDAYISNTPGVNPVQLITHCQLRTFGVDGSGLAFLEQAVVEGLRLPSLRLFEIANIDSEQFATNYPSISTYMSEQITHLGVFGTGRVAREALRTFIDTFPRLDTLSLHGAATEPALQALYRPPTSDGDNGGFNYMLPKGIQRVMICDYQRGWGGNLPTTSRDACRCSLERQKCQDHFPRLPQHSPRYQKEVLFVAGVQQTGGAE